jgi:sigma-B regulation protein RsbU (phosphoserine phosphatase)
MAAAARNVPEIGPADRPERASVPYAEEGSKTLHDQREAFHDRLRSANDDLDAVRRERALLQQAIYEAAQVQRRLCAPRELLWNEYEIAGEMFPVRHLSGDFFKVMNLDAALGLALGDIAGKGLTAGIWQTHMLGLTQRSARRHADPAAAVAEVNRELWQDQSEPPLTALFLARISPEGNDLEYCNAGQPAPLLLRGGQTPERLEEGGPMLGALQGAVYRTGRVRLDPGDMLIAYSDGVTECLNSRGDEFGIEKLAATASALRGASANQALFSTLATVLDFADACSASDDLTLLVVRRREGVPSGRGGSLRDEVSAPRRTSTSVARRRRPAAKAKVSES